MQDVDRHSSPPMTDVASRLDQPRVALPLLLGLGLALRLYNLGESLWYDEVVYSIHGNLNDAWKFVAGDWTPSAPLYPLLAFFWAQLTNPVAPDGPTFTYEVVVRFPSLVFGLGSIALTYLIARRFGRGAMPFLAGLVLCFSPAHIWYSQEATPYAMTMFFLLAAVYVWPRVAGASFDPTSYGVYLASLLASAFTHYFAAVFLLPFTLLALRSGKPVWRRVFIAHAIVVLSLAGWLGRQYLRGSLVPGAGFLRPFTIVEWWMLFFHWFLHGNSLWTVSPYRGGRLAYLLSNPGLLALQLMFAAILIWGLWPNRAKEPRTSSGELALYLCALPIVMCLVTVAGFRHVFIERYLLVAIPFFAIALARGATRSSSAWIRGGLTGIVMAVTVASWVMFLSKPTTWTVYKQNPDWRDAAAYLSNQNVPPDQIVVLGVVPLDDFGYHLRRQWPSGPSPDVHAYGPAIVDRLSAERHVTEIVLVNNTFWGANFDQVLETFKQDPRVRSTVVRSFKGVDLYTFVPVAAGASE